MAAGKLVIVTGFKELDAKLRQMEPKLQRKLVKGALRKGGKRVERESERIINEEAYDTGALKKSVTVRALKRSRKRIGVQILPQREKYFAKYAATHGGKQPNPSSGQSTPFYVPAAIEFGTKTARAIRPFRRALYDNKEEYLADFQADLAQFITEQKVDLKLPKASK